MTRAVGQLSHQRRYWLLIIILGLGMYVLLPQIGDFRQSLGLLHHLRWVYVWLAIGLAALTYVAAAGTYCLLAFKPLSYRRTLLVQLAAMFINRLLPAGVGALGVGYLYLRRARHSSSQAVTVVAVNNLMGVAGHTMLGVLVLILYHQVITTTQIHLHYKVTVQLWLIVLIFSLAGLLTVLQYRRRVELTVLDIARQLAHFRRRPQRILGALMTSMTLTLANVFCLWACLMALHLSLPLPAILAVFTLGLSIGNATPTPGGLGGLEAGLVAGLIAYHVPAAAALAAVILFRLITYWLALGVGALAFFITQRRGYLQLT